MPLDLVAPRGEWRIEYVLSGDGDPLDEVLIASPVLTHTLLFFQPATGGASILRKSVAESSAHWRHPTNGEAASFQLSIEDVEILERVQHHARHFVPTSQDPPIQPLGPNAAEVSEARAVVAAVMERDESHPPTIDSLVGALRHGTSVELPVHVAVCWAETTAVQRTVRRLFRRTYGLARSPLIETQDSTFFAISDAVARSKFNAFGTLGRVAKFADDKTAQLTGSILPVPPATELRYTQRDSGTNAPRIPSLPSHVCRRQFRSRVAPQRPLASPVSSDRD